MEFLWITIPQICLYSMANTRRTVSREAWFSFRLPKGSTPEREIGRLRAALPWKSAAREYSSRSATVSALSAFQPSCENRFRYRGFWFLGDAAGLVKGLLWPSLYLKMSFLGMMAT